MKIRLELWGTEGDRVRAWEERRGRMMLSADEEFPLIKGLVMEYYEVIRPKGEGIVWEWEGSSEGFGEMMRGFMEGCRRYGGARLVYRVLGSTGENK